MKALNSPISYDFHGDIAFKVPFEDILKKEISFYLDVDTTVNKHTCGQRCEHCWFVNYEKVHEKKFSFEEGHDIYTFLRDEGYKVYPRYVDSFAYDGKFMEIYGAQHNREFRYGEEHNLTETMESGDAWTSGKPLLGEKCKDLLDSCVANGFNTISITFHGTFDESGNLRPEQTYPIKGVFSGSKTLEVIKKIQLYNKNDLPKGKEPLNVNIGVTIGKHNHDLDSLRTYCELFNQIGINSLRFNCFTDHGKKHPHLQLNQNEIRNFYNDLNSLHESFQCDFQIGISEDFGTNGIEVLGLPKHVGWCRAGRQLFAITPVIPTLLEDGSEKIGEIVGCVNIFEPYLGFLSRKIVGDSIKYEVNFDTNAINSFTEERLTGVYKNGCFAGEMLHSTEYNIPLVKIKKRSEFSH
ncbi:MAG: radical SAM protein [Gammaproteobacteria bacterium]|nr:radical SAM protein [Gammaproteobacteria bacterium]